MKATPVKEKRPNCYVIAGSNGAGKTTFATRFLPHYADCLNFINPDLIARGLSPFDPDAGMIRAARLVLERIDEMRTARVDFAFETTLSGRTYAATLRNLRDDGYLIHMFYLWIPSPELALLRIKTRVQEGGHNVPTRDVRRRFGRTLKNLFHLYAPFIDTLRVFDNSEDEPIVIFQMKGGQTEIYDQETYKCIMSTT